MLLRQIVRGDQMTISTASKDYQVARMYLSYLYIRFCAAACRATGFQRRRSMSERIHLKRPPFGAKDTTSQALAGFSTLPCYTISRTARDRTAISGAKRTRLKLKS